MGAAIDLRKVDDLIEARIRFFLFEQITDITREGGAICEAGVVLLSATFQTFVEEVYLECFSKQVERDHNEKQQNSPHKKIDRWGNPSPRNIRKLFERQEINDVFENFRAAGLTKDHFIKQLCVMNSAKNCIAHGDDCLVHKDCITEEIQPVIINLSVLREWRRIIDQGSRTFRFCALHSSGF